ncbi:hypothetical protein [Aquisphaera insulae]|uniref:hypothetical protein n=1 Tax=Aquisphaera insulae TaxID=2712864 RepID=UPI0013E9B073|nr:hypothetical protein [Aquisphaera insulae]
MAETTLRFRCYRCKQLIGASSRKVGTAVECPRCKTELVVPEPDDAPAPEARGGAEPSLMDQIVAAIPDDLASIRPEDIRAEGEFANLIVTSPEPSPAAAEAPGGPRRERDGRSAEEPLRFEIPVPVPPELAPVDEVLVAALPSIAIDSPSLRRQDPDYPPVREVVLQPATVLAWSLLVLMAVPMAFIAGLLMGHFIWR